MRPFIDSLFQGVVLKKELTQSLWGHGIFLVGFLAFSLVSSLSSFRYEKFVTVNLTPLKSSGGGIPTAPRVSQSAAPKSVATPRPTQPPAKKEMPKPVQKPNPPLTQAPKVQKLAPKSTVQPKVVVQPKPSPTPSLSQRLKNRLNEVKALTSQKKFIEPDTVATPKNRVNQNFIEPSEWSKSKKHSAGSQTQMAAVGYGPGGSYGKEFPFAWYLELIQNKITLNWKEPPKSLITSDNPSAIVAFTIERDGQIQGTRIVARSSIDSLNQSVLSAVETSNPLPPLPDDFPGNQLNVKIKFELTS